MKIGPLLYSTFWNICNCLIYKLREGTNTWSGVHNLKDLWPCVCRTFGEHDLSIKTSIEQTTVNFCEKGYIGKTKRQLIKRRRSPLPHYLSPTSWTPQQSNHRTCMSLHVIDFLVLKTLCTGRWSIGIVNKKYQNKLRIFMSQSQILHVSQTNVRRYWTRANYDRT